MSDLIFTKHGVSNFRKTCTVFISVCKWKIPELHNPTPGSYTPVTYKLIFYTLIMSHLCIIHKS